MATRKKKNNIGAFGHPIYGKGFAKYGEMRPNGSSEIPNDLEEAAENYIAPIENDEGLDYINFNGRDIKDAFKAGEEWRRNKMLEEAVEGKIYGYDDGSYELVASWLDLPKGGIYKDGDKVRIVVLKEEE